MYGTAPDMSTWRCLRTIKIKNKILIYKENTKSLAPGPDDAWQKLCWPLPITINNSSKLHANRNVLNSIVRPVKIARRMTEKSTKIAMTNTFTYIYNKFHAK